MSLFRDMRGIEHDRRAVVADTVCQRMDSFEQFVRAGLDLQGFGASDLDVQIMRVVDSIYGPDMRALADAQLAGEWPELDLDPSRAPNPPPSP